MFVQKTPFVAGPVYKSSNELSTKDIEAKIKQINAAEVIFKEEQLLENIVAEEVEEEIVELTDIAAAEIVAEEIAEEVAELTYFLCNPNMRHLTGTEINLDGGKKSTI